MTDITPQEKDREDDEKKVPETTPVENPKPTEAPEVK